LLGATDEIDEGQRTNPNMSARQRRRERSMRSDTPRSSCEAIILEPRRRGSASGSERGDSAKSDRQRPGSSHTPTKPEIRVSQSIDDRTITMESVSRQTSVADDEESSSLENGDREMENLEMMLDATLHIAADLDDDDEALEKAAAPAPIPHVQSEPVIGQVPMFSKETLNSSGRLMGRIVALRKDCLRGVGLEKLHRSFQILDAVEDDDMEAKLLDLLGQDIFDAYAGKIWQLKFCEESAFK